MDEKCEPVSKGSFTTQDGGGTFRIAIIGGGIVGKTLAQALLTKVLDGSVRPKVVIRVFEAACGNKADKTDSRALELWPNAFAALDTVKSRAPSVSVSTLLKGDIGYKLERYDFRGLPGNLLLGIPTGALARGLSSETRVFTPKQLQCVVDGALTKSTLCAYEDFAKEAQEVDPAVHVHGDHTLVGLSMEGTGRDAVAKLSFHQNDGATTIPPLYADLVIAADGAGSSVRRLATHPRPPNGQPAQPLFTPTPPRVSRLIAIVGLAPTSHEFTQHGVGYVTHGNDIRFGAWPCPEEPTTKVRWILFLPATTVFTADPNASSPTYIKGFEDAFDDGIPRLSGGSVAFADVWRQWSKGAIDPTKPDDKTTTTLQQTRYAWLHRRLERCMIGMHKAATSAVAASFKDPCSPTIQLHVLADRAVSYKEWFAQRVALIGDAAHPILPDLGQGCGLSFEDVEAMARRLAEGLWPEGELKDWRDGKCSDDLIGEILGAWRDERHDRAAMIVGATRAASEAAHLDNAPAMVRDVMTMGAGSALLIPSLLEVIRYRPPDEVV